MYGDASAGLLLAVEVDSRVAILMRLQRHPEPRLGSTKRGPQARMWSQVSGPPERSLPVRACRIIAQVTDGGISLSLVMYRNHCVFP